MERRLDDAHLAAWRAFLRAHATAIEAIERELAAAGRVPLTSYDVLIELLEAPGRRLRMRDLARRVVLSRSGLTRLVDRLEREGLLARKPDPTDRRAILLELMERGKEQIAQVHALHRAIAERFFAPLDAGERCVLLRLLGKIRGGQGDRDS